MLASLFLMLLLGGTLKSVVESNSTKGGGIPPPYCTIVENTGIHYVLYERMEFKQNLSIREKKIYRTWRNSLLNNLDNKSAFQKAPPACEAYATKNLWHIFIENFETNNRLIDLVLPIPLNGPPTIERIEDRSFDDEGTLSTTTTVAPHHSHISPFSLEAFVVYAVLGSILAVGLTSFYVVYKRHKRTEREDAFRLEKCKMDDGEKTDERKHVLKFIAKEVGYQDGRLAPEPATNSPSSSKSMHDRESTL